MLKCILALALIATPAVLPAQHFRAQSNAPATQWHEPHGRFTITIPAGWRVDDSQGNLKITNGDSWAIFETTSGPATALEAAQRTAAQMQPMVSDWKVYSQGPYATALQHPAGGVSVTCTVPTKAGPTSRVMMFLAQSAGSNNYVTMTSSVDAPTGKQASTTLSQTFDSVRFANEQ